MGEEVRPAVRVSSLTKEYPIYAGKKDKLMEAFSLTGRSRHTSFEALKGVSFQVDRGECVGLIGLNGAGKSTLLKILAGVLYPTGGSVEISGKVSSLLELGAGFHPEYTGIENVYLTRTLMGCSGKDTSEHLDEILSFADIGMFAGQPVKKYSTGMFVRLAFATALSVSPDVMLIDEALSVGDVFFQKKCIGRLAELKKTSTILISSHDLNTLTKFCGRILVLHRGVLVFDGEPRDAVTAFCRIRQGEEIMAGQREGRHRQMTPEMLPSVFREPLPGQLSGKQQIVITAYSMVCDGVPFSGTCRPGSRLQFCLLVRTDKAWDDLIVGYQVLDRHGTEVFGETSLTSGCGERCLSAGESRISFEVTWPLVRDGDYFITLGVGTGEAVLAQTEQCWVNSAVHLVNVTGRRMVYGLFNNKMTGFSVHRKEDENDE